MKLYFLPVLIWTMAASQIFAQKTLSPSAQRSMEQWPLQVQNLMHKAGFNPETQSQSIAAASRSNPLQLDSTKLFHYSQNNATDSTALSRSIFQYPQTGVVVETQFQFGADNWIPIGRIETKFDAQERITGMIASEYDDATQTFQPGSKLELFPRGNAQTLVDSVKGYFWEEDIQDWAFAFQLSNTFNAQDRLLTAQTRYVADGQITLLIDNYSYNAGGDNHLTESFLINNGFPLPTGKEEMMYFNHLLIQTISFAPNGLGALAPTDRVTYLYSPSKLILQQNNYTWVPGVNDWNPTLNLFFEYDNAERLTVKTTEFVQGQQKERTTYEYIDAEDLSLESIYRWDAIQSAYFLQNRTYYYYAEQSSAVLPAPGTVQTMQLSPNPTLGEVRFPLDATAEIRVFDTAGKMLQTQRVQAGESLNLSALPAGIYQITAQTNGYFFTGKLIKQ